MVKNAEAAWKAAKRQRILDTGFRLFSEKGIDPVTMPDVAEASGVGRATLYRYYPTKLDLVMAIGALKWKEYIEQYRSFVPPERQNEMTAADYIRFYMDSFIDLYREHEDILRFNYYFNSFVEGENATEEQKGPYTRVVDELGKAFHALYAKGEADGTLETDIPEEVMFACSFHIMLAVVTRYAVGLMYSIKGKQELVNELVLLEEMMLSRFIKA